MFIVHLTFSDAKARAPEFLQAHRDWLKSGFDDGVFLLSGNLMPNLGGGIVAHGISRADLEARIDLDPFVAENVVKAEIVEIAPSLADPRLDFLVA